MICNHRSGVDAYLTTATPGPLGLASELLARCVDAARHVAASVGSLLRPTPSRRPGNVAESAAAAA